MAVLLLPRTKQKKGKKREDGEGGSEREEIKGNGPLCKNRAHCDLKNTF